ncbi:MAG: hypothetical protein Q9M18_05790 [Mariprofundaceae bacterium]|nr:hypothetical protein [Mariprofundaceae bacterium]
MAVMLPLFVCAEETLTVDAQFDKTGDHIVNKSDWKKMSEAEHIAYARASLEALGIDSYSHSSNDTPRWQAYLNGLNAAYK